MNVFDLMSEAIDKKITKKRKVSKINSGIPTKIIDHRLEDEQKINSLRRCVKCILPSTYPGIHFDEKAYATFAMIGKSLNFSKTAKNN